MFTVKAESKRYQTSDYNDALEYARFCAFYGYDVTITDGNGDEIEF